MTDTFPDNVNSFALEWSTLSCSHIHPTPSPDTAFFLLLKQLLLVDSVCVCVCVCVYVCGLLIIVRNYVLTRKKKIENFYINSDAEKNQNSLSSMCKVS